MRSTQRPPPLAQGATESWEEANSVDAIDCAATNELHGTTVGASQHPVPAGKNFCLGQSRTALRRSESPAGLVALWVELRQSDRARADGRKDEGFFRVRHGFGHH